jgi:hypothetical protein
VDVIPIPGIEVPFFKETGILRYMDFMIGVMECPVSIYDNCSVVVPAIR